MAAFFLFPMMPEAGFLSAEDALAYFDDLMQNRPSEPKVLGVAALLRRISDVLAPFSGIAVKGEIHSVTRSAAGHIYFDLKDEKEEAHLSCALFRGNASRLNFVPQRGDKVEITGEAGIYAPRGQLNFVVRTMKRAGAGDLYAQFVALKEKLLAEGLFDAAVKKPVPRFPAAIGIVTSVQAAALRDVVRTIRSVGVGVRVILYPTSVQGEAAEREILSALKKADADNLCDVILLVRGGGSLADLWTFNSEKIARQLRSLSTPVISGVGHETDTTIADLAADRRAATPTAAATLAMSGWHLAKTTVPENARRLAGLASGVLTAAELRLSRSLRYSRLFERKMETWARRVDVAASQIEHLPQRVVSQKTQRLERLVLRLSQVKPEVSTLSARVGGLTKLLARLARGDVMVRKERVKALSKQVKALAPEGVLARGYAMAIDKAGRVVTDASKLKAGDALCVRFKAGCADTRVETIRK